MRKQKARIMVAIAGAVCGIMLGSVVQEGISGSVPTTVTAASTISESRARQIALKDAGFSAKQVVGLFTDEYATYKSKRVFRIIFHKKRSGSQYTRYGYIVSRGGAILSRNKRDFKIVDRKKALNKALDKKDFERSDVRDLDIDFVADEYSGELVYDIEFTSKKSADPKDKSRDYTFTINAETGQIDDWDVDDDDDDDD